MQWSNLPEVRIKTDEKALYEGILIPELNYRNYKTFEKVNPEIQKLTKVEISQENSNNLFNDILWFGAGVLIGGIAVKIHESN